MMISMSACNGIKEEDTVGVEVSEDKQESNKVQSKIDNKDENETIKITQDTVIEAREASGGIGGAEYEHFGDCKYEGEAFIENIGSKSFTYETYTPSGELVHKGTLETGESHILNFSLSNSGLSDGRGRIRIASLDGGSVKANFMYSVLTN